MRVLISIFILFTALVTSAAESTGDSETETVSDREVPLLSLGLRLDAAFSAGGPIIQGFSLPGARLSAMGDVTPNLGYRFSLGQTREVTSVLLPQMMPIDAYLDVKSSAAKDGVSSFNWRFGMFRPTLTPWWTPDLDAVAMPDYHELNRALLLGYDVGTELTYRAPSDVWEGTLGAFNGNGNFTFNSNNSRSLAASVRRRFRFGDATLTFGAASYVLLQSSLGSINYKYDWVLTPFAQADFASLHTSIGVEMMSGYFEDSAHKISPFGGALYSFVGINDWMHIFARYENGRALPGASTYLKHIQLGPTFNLDRYLKVFVIYDYLEDPTGPESSFFVRARLVI